MIESILAMKTNELIVSFVINNIILLEIFRRILKWVVTKTKTKEDDDLPNLFDSLIAIVKRKGKKEQDRIE